MSVDAAMPPGWTANPSTWAQRLPIVGLAWKVMRGLRRGWAVSSRAGGLGVPRDRFDVVHRPERVSIP
jgi:hypothetical protein